MDSFYKLKNGTKIKPVIPELEFSNRIKKLRSYMERNNMQCIILTSIHNIKYYTNFLYCSFGRNYTALVTHSDVVLITAGIDSGNPWRRSVKCKNLTYTDYNKSNFYKTVKSEFLPDFKTIGYEADHINVQVFERIKNMWGAKYINVSQDLMKMRLIKSNAEIDIIKNAAKIANKVCDYILQNCKGQREIDIAQDANKIMYKEISDMYPTTELRDCWLWIQSGINTDGAHNALTSRTINEGDLLSINCFPMIDGYYIALERTVCVGKPSKERLKYWNINCEVFEKGISLIKPGVVVSDIAKELNKIYEKYGVLNFRTFGYGHSFGVLSHYYGRETILEIREDNNTVLEPGMVISMEPHITVPHTMPGAGGYREHDILLLTDSGHVNLTNYKYGPKNMII